jgi:hypothetical protein
MRIPLLRIAGTILSGSKWYTYRRPSLDTGNKRIKYMERKNWVVRQMIQSFGFSNISTWTTKR